MLMSIGHTKNGNMHRHIVPCYLIENLLINGNLGCLTLAKYVGGRLAVNQ